MLFLRYSADDIRDTDFKAYLASDSEDDAEDITFDDVAQDKSSSKKKGKTKTKKALPSVRSHGEASNSEECGSSDDDGLGVRGSSVAKPSQKSSYDKYRVSTLRMYSCGQ